MAKVEDHRLAKLSFGHALSTVMPLPSEARPAVKKPLLKTKSSNALTVWPSVKKPTNNVTSSMREQILKKQSSWGTLRNRLINAKISDAFSNIKFTLNGQSLQALRCIGEGGYAKVLNHWIRRHDQK